MTDELIEARFTTMENDIKEIKSDIKNMPEQIAQKVNESVDMKIKLALSQTENKISEIEKKYMGKFIALLIGLIGEAVGLIISFIR